MGIQKFPVDEQDVNRAWGISMPPLSLNPLSSKTYKVVPAKRDVDGNALIECTAEFSPAAASSFEVSTLIFEAENLGKTSYLKEKSRLLGRLNNKELSTSFTLSFRKEHRSKLLSFIPIGEGGSAAVSAKAKGSYNLTCKIRKKDEIPNFGSTGVNSDSIEAYYRTLLQTVAVMKASPGSRIEDVCSSCKSQYNQAVAQYTPLSKKMSRYLDQRRAIYDEWDSMLRLTSEYYANIETLYKQINEQDRKKIRRFVEISTAINEVNNACLFSPGQYIQLPYLFHRGSFPTTSKHLQSNVRHYDMPVPSRSKLEKEFIYMRERFSLISACGEAMAYITPYLAANKTETFRDVRELKAKYPALN